MLHRTGTIKHVSKAGNDCLADNVFHTTADRSSVVLRCIAHGKDDEALPAMWTIGRARDFECAVLHYISHANNIETFQQRRRLTEPESFSLHCPSLHSTCQSSTMLYQQRERAALRQKIATPKPLATVARHSCHHGATPNTNRYTRSQRPEGHSKDVRAVKGTLEHLQRCCRLVESLRALRARLEASPSLHSTQALA